MIKRPTEFFYFSRIQTIKFGGHVPSQMVLSKKVLTNFKRHTRTMGHKSPLYCITFDRTGKYIITVCFFPFEYSTKIPFPGS